MRATRRASARTLLALALTTVTLFTHSTLALAGRNSNGRLAVHTDDAVVYTATADYCSSTLPEVCESFNANGTQGIDREQVIWFVAAFVAESSPGVTAIQFGLQHDLPADQGYFTRWSTCGPSPLELPDPGWPESGFGNLVAFSRPVYDHLIKFYWFAVFREDDSNYFGMRTYPATGEAKFVDDSNPPVEDLIYTFGTVRWDGTGRTGCEWAVPPTGACCYLDGSCRITRPSECEGLYLGDFTVCDPNPCQLPEACCFCDYTCEMLLEADCLDRNGIPFGPGSDCETIGCAGPPAGACCVGAECLLLSGWCCDQQNGAFQGSGTLCDPNPCEETPVHSTTWGRIKASYR